MRSHGASHVEGPTLGVTLYCWRLEILHPFSAKSPPPCHSTSGLADYVDGSGYTTVLSPLTSEEHILIQTTQIVIQPRHPQTEQTQ